MISSTWCLELGQRGLARRPGAASARTGAAISAAASSPRWLGLGDRPGGRVSLGAGGLDPVQQLAPLARPARGTGRPRRRRRAGRAPHARRRDRRGSARWSSIRLASLLTARGSPRPRPCPPAAPSSRRCSSSAGSASATATPMPARLQQLEVVGAVAERDHRGRVDPKPLAHELAAPRPSRRPGCATSRKIGSDLAMNRRSSKRLRSRASSRRAASGSPTTTILVVGSVQPRVEVARRHGPSEPGVLGVGARLGVRLLDVQLVVDVDVHVEALAAHGRDHLERDRRRRSAGAAATRRVAGSATSAPW